jgi:hypothetical protein
MDEEQRIRALLAVKERDDFDRKVLEQQQKKLEDTRQRLEGGKILRIFSKYC